MLVEFFILIPICIKLLFNINRNQNDISNEGGNIAMKSKKHLSVTELNKKIIDTNNIIKKRKLGKVLNQKLTQSQLAIINRKVFIR